MIIHIDRAVVRRRLGRVADYCLICHSRRPFRLARLDYCTRVFLIPAGTIRCVGHERTCEACGQAYPADPADYPAVARDRRLGLDDLIARTHPGLEGGLAGERRANERLRHEPVDPGDRSALLAGPFHVARLLVDARLADAHIDVWSGLAVLALLFGAAPLAGFAFLTRDEPSRLPAGVGAGVIAVVTLAVVGTDEVRYMRRVVRPRLLRALAPFAPTPGELAALAATDPAVRRVARWVSLRKLCRPAAPG